MISPPGELRKGLQTRCGVLKSMAQRLGEQRSTAKRCGVPQISFTTLSLTALPLKLLNPLGIRIILLLQKAMIVGGRMANPGNFSCFGALIKSVEGSLVPPNHCSNA